MISALVGLFVVWMSGTPVQGVPASCTDGGPKQHAHEAGRKQGISLVEQAWASVKRDCAERPRIEQSVRDALAKRALPAGASEALKCRNAGFETGAHEALARLATTCGEK